MSVLVICALAATYLWVLDRQMRSSVASSAMMRAMGMAAGEPWRIADLSFTFAMWSVMMVGMMAPAALPMLLVISSAGARRLEPRGSATVVAFALGYATIWLGFSACATLAQWALHDAAMLSATMAAASPRVAGVLLIAAGVYQLTPAKHACLEHCQSPVSFLMSHWRDGLGGAYRMGLGHGVYCLGCCWALMGVLFAVGVMNLAWVAALTAFILLERVGPYGARVARLGGVVLAGLGVLRGIGL